MLLTQGGISLIIRVIGIVNKTNYYSTIILVETPMGGSKRMGYAILLVIIIAIVSGIIAYISFNILESSAEVKLQNWKAGGAFAAFIITFFVLTSVALQIYKQITSDKIDQYREQIQELQSKLIKGAPCPDGYIIDLDEKYKLVFARPNNWTPLNGLLYQYVNRVGPGNFDENFNVIYRNREDISDVYTRCGFGSFDPSNIKKDELFENMLKLEEIVFKGNFYSFEDYNISKEYINVDGIKSVKTVLTYAYVLTEGADKIRLCQVMVLTYIDRLNALYQFTFSDSEEEFFKTSEIFNTVISSIRFL